MTPEQKIIEEFEKEFVCDTHCINMKAVSPYATIPVMKSWLSSALKSYRQEIEKPFKHQKVMYQLGRKDALDEVRKGLPREKGKTGLVKMIFGDGHKDEIPVESNYDYGWNSYRQEVLELLNKLK